MNDEETDRRGKELVQMFGGLVLVLMMSKYRKTGTLEKVHELAQRCFQNKRTDQRFKRNELRRMERGVSVLVSIGGVHLPQDTKNKSMKRQRIFPYRRFANGIES